MKNQHYSINMGSINDTENYSMLAECGSSPIIVDGDISEGEIIEISSESGDET